MGAVVTALAADLLMMTTMQRRSIWVRNRSQAFTDIILAWDDQEWKKNFHISRATFCSSCNELRSELQHESTLREMRREWLLLFGGLGPMLNIEQCRICLVLAYPLLVTSSTKFVK